MRIKKILRTKKVSEQSQTINDSRMMSLIFGMAEVLDASPYVVGGGGNCLGSI